jgi:tetratricopeptide (TPR) repeat protein
MSPTILEVKGCFLLLLALNFCMIYTSGFAPAHQRLCGSFTRCASGVLLWQSSAGDDRNRFIPENMDEVPLSQIFQRAMVLQRSGVRDDALKAYEEFLQVAELHDVDLSLYAEVHSNMGAIFAMQGKNCDTKAEKHELRQKAKTSFQKAVEYRPGLGTAWVNLALLLLAEGKDNSGYDISAVEKVLKEARSCCERALGMENEDKKSWQLANKLMGDIDAMIKQNSAQKPFQ